MNLIHSLNLLSALSNDNIANSPRALELVTGNTTEVVNRGLDACGFNFTSDETNTEVYKYEAGELCSYGVTAISFFTSPIHTSISKEDNSNTFAMQTTYHFAVMDSDNEDGKVYCYEDGKISSSSKQYRDGSASFVISGGEITVGPQNVGNWTTIDVNGGESVNIPGFYYVEEGIAEGGVIFLNDEKTLTEPNYTSIEGTLIDLCYAAAPTLAPTQAPLTAAALKNGAAAKNVLLVIGAMLPASAFFLM
jgi:hypothetical protein